MIGLSHLYYATMTADTTGGTTTYATPVQIPGVISAKINPNATVDTLFAEDGPYEVASQLGKISVDINAADIDYATQAVLLGHTMGADGILLRKASDTPPWIAIGFKAMKSNGKYRYVWLTKGKFTIPQEDHQTKADKVNFQTPTIQGNFVQRESDGIWIRQTDEEATGYTATTGTNWFQSVG